MNMKPKEILGLIEEAAGTRMFGAGRLATTIDCGHPVQLGVAVPVCGCAMR